MLKYGSEVGFFHCNAESISNKGMLAVCLMLVVDTKHYSQIKKQNGRVKSKLFGIELNQQMR
jgi:hypothetical protein